MLGSTTVVVVASGGSGLVVVGAGVVSGLGALVGGVLSFVALVVGGMLSLVAVVGGVDSVVPPPIAGPEPPPGDVPDVLGGAWVVVDGEGIDVVDCTTVVVDGIGTKIADDDAGVLLSPFAVATTSTLRYLPASDPSTSYVDEFVPIVV